MNRLKTIDDGKREGYKRTKGKSGGRSSWGRMRPENNDDNDDNDDLASIGVGSTTSYIT